MPAFTTKCTLSPVVCSSKKKLAKKFKKFGKRMYQERQLDLERYGQRLKDISVEERKRSQQLFEEHRRFIQKNLVDSYDEDETTTTAIDFFEK